MREGWRHEGFGGCKPYLTEGDYMEYLTPPDGAKSQLRENHHHRLGLGRDLPVVIHTG